MSRIDWIDFPQSCTPTWKTRFWEKRAQSLKTGWIIVSINRPREPLGPAAQKLCWFRTNPFRKVFLTCFRLEISNKQKIDFSKVTHRSTPLNRAFSCSNVHAKWWLHCLLKSLRCQLSHATSIYDRPKPFFGLFFVFWNNCRIWANRAFRIIGVCTAVFEISKQLLYYLSRWSRVRLSWNCDMYRLLRDVSIEWGHSHVQITKNSMCFFPICNEKTPFLACFTREKVAHIYLIRDVIWCFILTKEDKWHVMRRYARHTERYE